MKKYLGLLKFALKEQMEYKWNFVIGIITMLINDALFIFLFIIYLWYFSGIWISLWDFLLLWSLVAFYYGITNGLLANISRISFLIEEGKMDYYLSFPLNTLKFLSFSKINVYGMGDLFFALIALVIYLLYYSTISWWIVLLSWLGIIILWTIFSIWFTIIVSSISFWLDKWSLVSQVIREFSVSFGLYPPKIYRSNKVLFTIIGVLGLYPMVFLPYNMIINGSTWTDWLVMIVICIPTFFLSLWVFKKWLWKYNSGNLVMQM